MARKHLVPALLTACLAAAGSAFMVPASIETAEASDPTEEGFRPRVSGLRSASFGYGVDEVAFGPGERFESVTRDLCEFMALAGVGRSRTLSVNGRELPVGPSAASACADGSDNVVVIGSAP